MGTKLQIKETKHCLETKFKQIYYLLKVAFLISRERTNYSINLFKATS